MLPGRRPVSVSNMASSNVPRMQWRMSGETLPQTPDQQGTCPYRELCRVEHSPIALHAREGPLDRRKRGGFRGAMDSAAWPGSFLRALLHGHCARAIFV